MKRTKRSGSGSCSPSPIRKLPKLRAKTEVKSEISEELNVGRIGILQESSPAYPEEADRDGLLEDMKIVITGKPVIHSETSLEDAIAVAGGRIVGSVSGLTNILICAPTLEDGRPYTAGTKYNKAKQLIDTGKSKAGLQILTEEDFYKTYPGIKAIFSKTLGRIATDPVTASADDSHFIWAEKWRPRTTTEFAFNREPLQQLMNWLKGWSENSNEHAALLCGPPGVGKTSASLAVADMLGYRLIEFNASDTRSQKQLKNLLPLIGGGLNLSKGVIQNKIVLLMDEADGLSAGDRGGSQELTRIIKISKVPIICTCNDKENQKVRTLSKSCKVIAFEKPDRSSAVDRVLQITKAEGLSVTRTLVEQIFDSSDGDMRHMLNGAQMQVLGCTAMRTNGTNNSGNLNSLILKDARANEDVQNSVKRLFSTPPDVMKWTERQDVFFSDYDKVPLYVFENYIKALGSKADHRDLGKLMMVSYGFSLAEVLNSKIRGQGYWDLLPDVGYFTTTFPTLLITGSIYRADFPRMLGHMSTTNKHKRQLSELAMKLGRGGRRFVADGYFECLGDVVVAPLLKEKEDPAVRVEKFLELAEKYKLSKTMIIENLMDTRINVAPSPYERVESKVKAAVTRAMATLVEPGELIVSRRTIGKTKRKKNDPFIKLTDETTSETPVEELDDEIAEEEQRMGTIF